MGIGPASCLGAACDRGAWLRGVAEVWTLRHEPRRGGRDWGLCDAILTDRRDGLLLARGFTCGDTTKAPSIISKACRKTAIPSILALLEIAKFGFRPAPVPTSCSSLQLPPSTVASSGENRGSRPSPGGKHEGRSALYGEPMTQTHFEPLRFRACFLVVST